MAHRDPGLAAIASFFVWGLGHIYHGRFWAGFTLSLLQAFIILVTFALPGLALGIAEPPAWLPAAWLLGALFYIPTWIAQVVAAYRSAEAANLAEMEQAEERRRQDAELARIAAALRQGGTPPPQAGKPT